MEQFKEVAKRNRMAKYIDEPKWKEGMQVIQDLANKCAPLAKIDGRSGKKCKKAIQECGTKTRTSYQDKDSGRSQGEKLQTDHRWRYSSFPSREIQEIAQITCHGAERIFELVSLVPQERVHQHTVEQIVNAAGCTC